MTQPSAAAITTFNVDQTLALGQVLGRLAPPNTCLALYGNLGAGKTHLTRGIAAGANVDDPSLVSSPTYVLLNIYPGPRPVFHLDAYRIASEQDFEVVGFDELLQNRGIVVVEWAEKIPDLLPPDRLDILIQPGEHTEERSFTLTPAGPAHALLASGIIAAWQQRA